MKQISLASSGFEKFSRATKRSVFLAEMDRVVPWSALCQLVEPVYPQNEVGRPPTVARADAADPLSAGLVQSVGPSGGRSAVRLGSDAAVRRD